jgi:O-antigen/teichoic acid export membrane protein
MYLSIIGIPFIFLTPLLSYIYPIISSLAGKEEYEKITLLRNYLERIFSVIGGLFGIGLFVFAKPIMLIIF